MGKCGFCGEPKIWHILLGQPIDTGDWHSITEFMLRPSKVFPLLPAETIPRQRAVESRRLV